MEKFLHLGLLLVTLLAHPQGQQGYPPKARGAKSSVTERSQGREASTPRPATTDSGYVIGPEDIIDVSVWKEPDFSRTVPVRPDGKISLPLLNDIQAAGSTPVQLAGFITEQLKKYLTQPQVTIIVVVINSRRVYIIGEVNRPGTFPLLPNMNVLQALSLAGGPSQFADPKKMLILRNEGARQLTFHFNYKDALKGKRLDQNIVLQAGDMIVVP